MTLTSPTTFYRTELTLSRLRECTDCAWSTLFANVIKDTFLMDWLMCVSCEINKIPSVVCGNCLFILKHISNCSGGYMMCGREPLVQILTTNFLVLFLFKLVCYTIIQWHIHASCNINTSIVLGKIKLSLIYQSILSVISPFQCQNKIIV